MLKPVRRIIAAHNENGESYIQEDGAAPNITNTGGIEGFSWTELWALDDTPASNAGNADAGEYLVHLAASQLAFVKFVFEFIDFHEFCLPGYGSVPR